MERPQIERRAELVLGALRSAGRSGRSLFVRRGRGIVLTAFGRYFAAQATAILNHVASVPHHKDHF
ncbi:MAG TPA: hypothetical protein VF516_09020 [Kofleriaceae bacterium]